MFLRRDGRLPVFVADITNNAVERDPGCEYNPSPLGDTESLDAALKGEPTER
jgi:hypothetical protein